MTGSPCFIRMGLLRVTGRRGWNRKPARSTKHAGIGSRCSSGSAHACEAASYHQKWIFNEPVSQ